METLELTAPTLEDARRQAAAEFGVDPSLVNVVVLEEKKGLFGKPGSFKVRAEKPAAAPAPAPVEEPAPVAAAAPEAEAAPAAAKPKGRARKPKAEAEPAAEKTEEAPAEAPAEAAAPEAESDSQSVVASEADGQKMVEIFNHIFAEGDLKAKATVVSLTGKYVNIELDGRDVGYLVGKRGEVLNALQYIGNVIATRQLGNGVRVVIDGNSFRAKRQEVLEKQAKEIAEQVKLNEMEAVLDPLPAFERRLVHQVLSEYPGVVTYSEGEEPNRRVVIAPAE